MNEHHRRPQAAGGGDDKGNLVFLCPSCHTNIHAVAVKLMKGKGGKASNILESCYTTPSMRQRATDLVQEIVEAMADRNDSSAEHIRYQIRFPKELYRQLSALRKSVKNAQGKQPSIESYVIGILKNHVAKNNLT